MKSWYGFDFDGTLATYTKGQWPEIGQPIKLMCDLVRQFLAEEKSVKIVSARIWPIGTLDEYVDEYKEYIPGARLGMQKISQFCQEQFNRVLPIVCYKDFGMIRLYDDRVVQVIPNTGELVEDLLNRTKADLDSYKQYLFIAEQDIRDLNFDMNYLENNLEDNFG